MNRHKRSAALIAGALASVFLFIPEGWCETPGTGPQDAPNTLLGRIISSHATRFLLLRGELNLTQEQRASARMIVARHRQEIGPAIQTVLGKRRTLRQAVLTDSPDEPTIRQAAKELGTAIADAAVIASRIKGELQSVLTDEQRQCIRKHLGEMDASQDRFLKEFVETP